MKMPEYVVVKIMPNKKGTSYSLEVVADTDFVNDASGIHALQLGGKMTSVLMERGEGMREWIIAYDEDGNEEVHDELVRCKDCVFFGGNDKLCAYDIRTVEEGYCFFGERIEVNERSIKNGN